MWSLFCRFSLFSAKNHTQPLFCKVRIAFLIPACYIDSAKQVVAATCWLYLQRPEESKENDHGTSRKKDHEDRARGRAPCPARVARRRHRHGGDRLSARRAPPPRRHAIRARVHAALRQGRHRAPHGESGAHASRTRATGAASSSTRPSGPRVCATPRPRPRALFTTT